MPAEIQNALQALPRLRLPLIRTILSRKRAGYASYQLIRNVLAAYAAGCSFCVLHDERRPDLREEWFQVMAAVKSAEMRVRLKVLTWQELAALLTRRVAGVSRSEIRNRRSGKNRLVRSRDARLRSDD